MQLKAERPPRASKIEPADPADQAYANKERQRRYSWSWNIPLLLASAAVFAVASSGIAGLYLWQSNRLSTEMLDRAKAAAEAEDYPEQIKWLTRYVRAAPNDVEALIQLGIATDNDVNKSWDLHDARVRLSNAIAATRELPAFESQRTELRRRLIKRLLQLRGVWAAEAERQVIFLSAPPEDPQALSWLAQAIATQRLAKQTLDRDGAIFDREKEYWQWMASQPVGYIIQQALARNPDDIQLNAFFLVAVGFPEWFAGASASSAEELQKQADELCDRLAAQVDSGRAQYLVYDFKVKHDRDAARALLKDAFPGALARLNDHLKQRYEPSLTATEAKFAIVESEATPVTENYTPYWDWQLVSAAAGQAMVESRFDDALAIYDQLISLASSDVNADQREAAHLAAGRAYVRQGNVDKAIEIWTTGVQSLPDSVELLGALAQALVDRGDAEEAEKSLEEFEKSIARNVAALDATTVYQITPATRQRISEALDLARWQSGVIRASIELLQGNYVSATERLVTAFNSPLPIDANFRLRSGRLLAHSYEQQQLWDLVAQTLDRCVHLRPDDLALRRQAATAWARAGAAVRTTLQPEAFDDGSFAAAVEIARLTAVANATQSPAQRNAGNVRKAIQTARLRWEALSESQRSGQPSWALDVLELSFPEEEAADPEKRNDRLEALAQQYPTIPEVQKFAAVNLAESGRLPAAKQALQRLKKLAEVSGKASDAAGTLLYEARIVELTDGLEAAFALLREGIKAIPKESVRLAKTGAGFAMMRRQPETAYEFLRLVPERDWDVDILVLAARLGARSNDLATELEIADADLQRWEERLRELEGEKGCNWRYVAAQRLLSKAARGRRQSDFLEQAEQYYTEINQLRPQWGMGAALGGQIAFLQGKHLQAVARLQHAIENGNMETPTVMGLVKALIATGQYERADQELQRLAGLTDNPGQTSLAEISLARMKGDLQAALELARNWTSRDRNDPTSWIVNFQAATAVARSPATESDAKAKLRSEAWDAIEQATRLTEGKSLTVWNARLQFYIEAGDKAKAREELEALQVTVLPRKDAVLAAANGFLALRDYETAKARAKEAIALDPKSARPHLTLAHILEQTGDRQGVLSELQTAYRLDTSDAEIRKQLATAYVLASEEIPWAEVDQLLSDSEDTNSPLLKAMLSLQRGDEQRIQTAVSLLKTIADTDSAESRTAKRILAEHFAKQWLNATSAERESFKGRRNLEQAQSIYRELFGTGTPTPADGLPLAYLLVEAEQFDNAKAVLDELSSFGTLPGVLQLRLKIAKLQGEDVSSVASSWIASATGLEQEELWETVGNSMSQIDFHEEAVQWLEKAYLKNATKFTSFARGLARAGQTQKAIDLCILHLNDAENLQAATLLSELVLLNNGESQSEVVEEALAGALKKHPDSAPLLGSIATVRLMQGRYAESVALYEQADRLAPNQPRTLNNLAIAMVEVPMRQDAALDKINKAIRLYGRYPQFLDTLATVHAKLGEHQKAKEALEEALSQEKDPRYQLRLVEQLIALGSRGEAKNVWGQIDVDGLQATSLTPAEKKTFTKLMKEMDSDK